MAELAPAEPDDAVALARIAARSLPSPWDQSAFESELARPRTRCHVARVDGAPIAYALGWQVHDQLEVLSLAVDPDWREMGVGRSLLDAYLKSLQIGGVRKVLLEVRASNLAAQNLYQGLGMTECGHRARYYADGEDALVFTTELA